MCIAVADKTHNCLPYRIPSFKPPTKAGQALTDNKNGREDEVDEKNKQFAVI